VNSRTSIVLPSSEPVALGFCPARLDRLHRRIQQFVDDHQHAGLSLLLARNGKIADIFVAGFRDRELGLPILRDTIFRTYSMTKMVVSVGALILLEEGELGLLDPVEAYLPEFRDARVLVGGTVQDPLTVPVDKAMTIQHLFTHTSGLIYDAPGELIDEFYRPWTGGGDSTSLEELANNLARLPLKCHPGTRFEYGFSKDVLGRVIEVISGKRLDSYLNTSVLEPLEMFDTGYAVPSAQKERLAKVYQHDQNGALRPVRVLREEIAEGEGGFPGGGTALFSTLDDFARFAQMLCNKGELAGVRLMGRKTWELMVSNHLTGLENPFHNHGLGHGFGLGVGVRMDNGLAGTLGTLGSFGWTGMATTFCCIDPAERLVALCFAQHLPHDEHGLFHRFANLVYQALS
jgi:CubicO group peptidase (beta-lactamase class C family)